jgi:hypothetical protein
VQRLALLVAFALLGCGSTPTQSVLSRHVILTTTTQGTAEDRSVRDYVDDRHGTLIHFTDLARDLKALRLELQRMRPTFVTVILRAEQLTANNVFAFYEAAASFDPDPFADFMYGFVPYDSPATLAQWIKSVRIADFRRDKTLIAAAVYEAAGVDSSTKENLPWAANLPLTTVRAKDAAFVKAHASDLELANVLLLNGPAAPVLDLKLDSQIVVSALPLFPPHDVDPNLPSSLKIATALLRQGAVAVLGPLEGDSATVARAEFDGCIGSRVPLGLIIKRTWDEAILALGGKATLPRFETNTPDPSDWSRHPRELAAMSRVLLGDPSMEPFTRSSQEAFTLTNSFEKLDESSHALTVARFTVSQPVIASAFLDAYTLENGIFADRLHLVAELPAVTHEAIADLVSSELDTVAVAARVNAQAFEAFEGKAYAHVIVGGAADSLRKKNLTITISVKRQ